MLSDIPSPISQFHKWGKEENLRRIFRGIHVRFLNSRKGTSKTNGSNFFAATFKSFGYF